MGGVDAKAPSLLAGLVYDDTGDRLCPTHASKKGRRYRYYISKRLMHRTGSTDGGWRLPASELEGAVAQAVAKFQQDKLRVVDALQLAETAPDRLRAILSRAATAARELHDDQPERHRQLLHLLLHRITLQAGSMRIELKRSGLWRLVAGTDPDNSAHADGLIAVTVPIEPRRRGVEAKLILRATERAAVTPDQYMINLIARAHLWFRQLVEGEVGSIREIARQEDIDEGDVSRFLPLAFLAPDIVEAIFAGNQPPEMTAEKLKRLRFLPHGWQEQRASLGFHS